MTHSHHPKTKTGETYKRCADSHPKLVIPVGDRKYEIVGGSVHTVKPSNFDVVIAFEGSYKGSAMALPWTPGIEFTYRITDGCAPGNPKNFRALVEYVATRLLFHKKVFTGCIGGHGRTGMFLAALVAHMNGEVDAITYVRKHYCKKAVESERQVKFLNKEYGIKEVEGSKEWNGTPDWSKGVGLTGEYTSRFGSEVLDFPPHPKISKDWWPKNTAHVTSGSSGGSRVRELSPVLTDLSIHGCNGPVK